MPVSGLHKIKGVMPNQNKLIEITGEVINGRVIVEGDIIAGTVSKYFGPRKLSSGGNNSLQFFYKWDGSIIPFELPNNLRAKEDILRAIVHINKNTNLALIPRTNQEDYVKFIDNGFCESYIGRQKGRQDISVTGGCGFGAAVHEIIHAAGFWHEQSRKDRDQYVNIFWKNIPSKEVHNFQSYIEKDDYGIDIGNYDYASIMHYEKDAFAIDKSKPTILPKDLTIPIGNRSGLSAGDIAGINMMYPVKGKVSYIASISEKIPTTGSKQLGVLLDWKKIIGKANDPDAIVLVIKVPTKKSHNLNYNKTTYSDYVLHSVKANSFSDELYRQFIVNNLPNDVPIEIEININEEKWTNKEEHSASCKVVMRPDFCLYSLTYNETNKSNLEPAIFSNHYVIPANANGSQLNFAITGGWLTGKLPVVVQHKNDMKVVIQDPKLNTPINNINKLKVLDKIPVKKNIVINKKVIKQLR